MWGDGRGESPGRNYTCSQPTPGARGWEARLVYGFRETNRARFSLSNPHDINFQANSSFAVYMVF